MEQKPNLPELTNDQTPNPPAVPPTPQIVTATPVQHGLPAPATPPGDLPLLTAAQLTTLHALTAGCSVAEAAREAGIHPATIYRWKKDDPRFIVTMNAWRSEALASARDRFLALTDEAVRTAYRLLRKDNASVAIAIIKALGPIVGDKPGVIDVDEASDELRTDRRKRDDARKRRLREEAKAIRDDAHCKLRRTQRTQKQLEDTFALAATEPESVMAELRRADELEVEANGLPGLNDVPPSQRIAAPPEQQNRSAAGK